MKKGFSLVELLVSLIIISLIIGLFIPTLTKKLKYKEITLSKSSALSSCDKFDEKNRCVICNKEKCILCLGQLTPLEGHYINPETGCDYKACPENCSVCNTEAKCLNCKEQYYLSEESKCISCKTTWGQYCSTCNKTGCLSCINDNYELSDNRKSCIAINPCKDKNAVLVENSSKSVRFCMKKINSPESQVTTGYGTCQKTGTTSCTKDDTQGSGFTYSGCERIVCGWNDANNLCKSIGWKLPSNDQLTLLANILKSETSSTKSTNIQKYNPEALQLCDNTSAQNTGSPICREVGNLDSDCLWSSTPASGGYYNFCLNSGILKAYIDAAPNPRSVRCILEL